MKGQLAAIIAEKVATTIETPPPVLTRREMPDR
jgi:hypothetical protein